MPFNNDKYVSDMVKLISETLVPNALIAGNNNIQSREANHAAIDAILFKYPQEVNFLTRFMCAYTHDNLYIRICMLYNEPKYYAYSSELNDDSLINFHKSSMKFPFSEVHKEEQKILCDWINTNLKYFKKQYVSTSVNYPKENRFTITFAFPYSEDISESNITFKIKDEIDEINQVNISIDLPSFLKFREF